MRIRFLFILAVSRADDRSPALRAIATSDVTEVHPDGVFEVTLSLENLTNSVQRIRVPDTGWDRVWKSNNRRVSWDAWESDDNAETTIEIPPHETYVFPKTLKMFVDENYTQARIEFRMGFKATGGPFGKMVWSSPITLDVIQ
jgi:hypothetical protein